MHLVLLFSILVVSLQLFTVSKGSWFVRYDLRAEMVLGWGALKYIGIISDKNPIKKYDGETLSSD